MNFLRRITSLVTKAEGEYRPGPWFLPVTGGWLPADVGNTWNWWQRGYDVVGGMSNSAIVEACISAYAQTVAMCPGSHWLTNERDGRDRQINSALSRILRKPNDYQSMSDFMLNLTRWLYMDGNAYALALRNDRYEIDSLHLMNSAQCNPQLAENGDIFYSLGGNDVISRRIDGPLVVPQRDVLHVRLHCTSRTPRPLKGETPLVAAMQDVAATNAMTEQQIQYYKNQARPSAVLSTDLVLDKDQVQFLRDRWNEQVKGIHSGGTPILTSGLKVQPWSTSAKDAELAEVMKLTEAHIAMAFRVPLAVLGIGGQTYSSTELLMQSWIASGLGFALNHIEESFGRLFNLYGMPDEYAEFDTSALLRSARKDRIEMLARGVQGGIFSPNEARKEEDMEAVSFGDEPRVQQQVVPLSAAAAIPGAGGPMGGGAPGELPPAPGPGAPPSAAAAGGPGGKGAGLDLGQPAEDDSLPEKQAPVPARKVEDVQREVKRLRDTAARIRRKLG